MYREGTDDERRKTSAAGTSATVAKQRNATPKIGLPIGLLVSGRVPIRIRGREWSTSTSEVEDGSRINRFWCHSG